MPVSKAAEVMIISRRQGVGGGEGHSDGSGGRNFIQSSLNIFLKYF